MIMTANYHTHTTRCKHAVGSEREYIETAIKKGFKTLGFSDHSPQPFTGGLGDVIRMRLYQAEEYTDTLLKLREEYKDSIDILIGYEVEYYRDAFGVLLNELRKYPLDYLILGQHYAPDEFRGFYAGEYTTNENRLKAYVDMAIEGMMTGEFLYLAHPDLINYHGNDGAYVRQMTRLIQKAVDLNIPLEINLFGMVDNRQYPSGRFFSLASEMGAKFVLGCDAHYPDMIKQPEEIKGFDTFLEKNHIAEEDIISEFSFPLSPEK